MQAPNETSAVRQSFDVLRKAAGDKPYLDADEREDLLSRLISLRCRWRSIGRIGNVRPRRSRGSENSVTLRFGWQVAISVSAVMSPARASARL